MPENETLIIKTDKLKEDAKKLRLESVGKLAQQPPIKAGEGQMADQMDAMVQNMAQLYQKSDDLIEATAQMLEKMGIEFEIMDQTASDSYQAVD